jgi:3-dehydroquinate synthetase
MIAASRLAQRIGMLGELDARRVETLVHRAGPLPPLPSREPARLVEIMGSDKKTRGGKLRFVLARKIGQVETVGSVSTAMVLRVLSGLQKENARPFRPSGEK